MSDVLFYQGQKVKIKLPSSKEVTIREQNGEDEGELTKLANQVDASFISKFLNRVVEEDHDIKRKPLVTEIDEWKQRDRLYTLFAVRVLSLGKIYKFSEDIPDTDPVEKQTFEIDLEEEFCKGYGQSDYKPKKYSIEDYPLGRADSHQFTTSSGKSFRFQILTGALENKSLATIPNDQFNKNTPLLIRNLQVYNQEQWQDVKNFSAFGSLEMRELRAEVNKVDKPWEPFIEYTFENSKIVNYKPLLGSGDFFFQEMI